MHQALRKVTSYTILSLTLASMLSSAQAQSISSALPTCAPTPSVANKVNYPEGVNIPRSNDLRRKTGLGFVAEGTPIRIKGRLLDKTCSPIEGAKVEIWHADNKGNYIPYSNDKYFSGAGRTYTDNLGRFYFTTIFPGTENAASIVEEQNEILDEEEVASIISPEDESILGNDDSPVIAAVDDILEDDIRAPVIHFHVSPTDLEDASFNTDMYFAGHPYNLKDPILETLEGENKPVAAKEAGGAIDTYLFNIVLQRRAIYNAN